MVSEPTVLGVISSLPILGDMRARMQGMASPQWALAQQLTTAFEVVNLPPSFDEEGRFSDEPRVPMEYLRYLFGPEVDQALITIMEEMERKKAGKESELMDLLIARDWKQLLGPYTQDPAELERPPKK